ncbi:hypothetical protein KAI68_02230 [bacterium]|nr:hypothetical protein [bacterium]
MIKKFSLVIFSFLVLGMLFARGAAGVKIVGSSPVERRLESKKVEAPVETVVSGEKAEVKPEEKKEEIEKGNKGLVFIIIAGVVIGWILLKSPKKKNKKKKR